MKCISASIPYHGLKIDGAGPVGGPIISWPWNGDNAATAYERYTNWGGVGPYGTNTTFVWREKIDIRGLTMNMEKTIFPDHVTFERSFVRNEVNSNPEEWVDTVILSRVPISDDDLQRIPADEGSFAGGLLPGNHGTDTDASDVIYLHQTMFSHRSDITTPLTQEFFNEGGRLQPLASMFIWVYRVVQTRWVATTPLQNGASLIPAMNLYLHVDTDKEDVIPYLSRLAMSVKTVK